MGKKTALHPQSDRWCSLFVCLSASQWEVFTTESHHYLAPHSVPGSAPLAAYRELLRRNALTSSASHKNSCFSQQSAPPAPLLTWLPRTTTITFPLFKCQTQTALGSNSRSDVATTSYRTSRQDGAHTRGMTA